jgi:hypothetical protein
MSRATWHWSTSFVAAVLLIGGVSSAGASAASGEGAPPSAIPPRTLEVHGGELPGFAGTKKKLEVFESVRRFVEGQNATRTEMEVAKALLTKRGFQDTVAEIFRGPHREAVFEAFTFTSPQGAAEQFPETVTTDLKRVRDHGLMSTTVKGIPGSVLIGQFETGHGGTGNVLFVSGRCLFIVGDAMARATSRQQAYHAPIVAARHILRRDRAACARR